ncbi:YceI family protein [Aquimarina spinulae]|uniref:YceI family protein n=1 Tax=Aquimarina spinulae TaxID=1192023 RepID=UPI000D562551|nr:YceI family protein [Aquimarina spinulae]
MKKIILVVVIIFLIPTTYAQQDLRIDTGKSIINWQGSDLLNLNTHNGTVKLKNGVIRRKGILITGGEFEIDMNSIINIGDQYNEMLITHLKSKDFFNVKKHPIAKLEIINTRYINATNLDVIAYLTINDIRHIIQYQSTIENINNQVLMKSKFVIDRTLWKINYKSKNFLINLKDDIISNTIDFEVFVVANQDGC